MIYTFTNNKSDWSKYNDKEILDEDEITAYPFGSNLPFIKCVDDKDIPNSIEELKKSYKTFTENVQT